MVVKEVRNLSGVSASDISLILKVIFDAHIPGLFIPGRYYNAGEIVYLTSEDYSTLKLWICNMSGFYDTVSEPYWSEWSFIDSLIDKLQKLLELTADKNPLMFDPVETIGSLYLPDYDEALYDINHIPALIDLYYDGKYIDSSNYTVSDIELVPGPGLTLDDTTKTLMVYNVPVSKLSRFVRRKDMVETKLDAVDVPVPTGLPNYGIKVYDLYVNGLFINPTLYEEYDSVSYGVTTRRLRSKSPDFVINTGDKVVFVYTYSIASSLLLSNIVSRKTITTDMESFIVDIVDSGYINVYQTLQVFKNGIKVDDNIFHYSKGRLHVREIADYFKSGDIVDVVVKTFIPNPYDFAEDYPGRRYNTESIYVDEDHTRKIPIPFIDYNEAIDDFLLFNDNGALLSSAKWYSDNNHVHYFQHDQGLFVNDTVNFRMFDRNANVTMRNVIVDASTEDQRVYNLGINVDDYEYIMLFYVNGCYLSPEIYTIDPITNILTINDEIDLNIGERLELILFSTPSGKGTTKITRHCIKVTDVDVQNKFNLYFRYDAVRSNLICFANTGLYIGEKFYKIGEDNTLTITGEPIYKNGWLDIILVESVATVVL